MLVILEIVESEFQAILEVGYLKWKMKTNKNAFCDLW